MENTPLSPHLQVYRPQLTSVLSITHRATGVVLSLAGTVIMLYWFVATALGADAYASAQGVLSSIFAKLIMFGWTCAFYYHLLNGIRHLLWDTGWGFDLVTAYRTGYAVVCGTIVLSVSTWGLITYLGKG